jgi:hypothetical protein
MQTLSKSKRLEGIPKQTSRPVDQPEQAAA